MALDTSAAVLETLAKQGAPERAVAAVKEFQQTVERIKRERYAPDREAEEIALARNTATLELREAQAESELMVDRERDDEIQRLDVERATRSRERRELRDVIDIRRLEVSEDPDELLALVADAERHGDEVGRAAAKLAHERVKKLALLDQRKHVLNGRAFSVMVALSQKTTRGGGFDASAVRERYAQKKGALKTIISQVANTVGLADALKTAATRAAIPVTTTAPTKSTLTVGRWWDDHPEFRQGR